MKRRHRHTTKGPRHPIPALKDGDLLHGHPPSLWGIVPTKTPIEEAREILREKGVLRACERYHAESTGSTGIACWPYFNLNHEHGVVKFVEFKPSVPITFAEVIARHGVPEGVLSIFTDNPDGSIYTLMIAFYERIWTMISLAQQVPRVYKVSAETLVARVTYSKPHPAVVTSSQRVRWRGYGDYEASDATSD